MFLMAASKSLLPESPELFSTGLGVGGGAVGAAGGGGIETGGGGGGGGIAAE